MIRKAWLLWLALALPAGAQGLTGQALCDAVWTDLSSRVSVEIPVTGTPAAMEGDWCVVDRVVIDLTSGYAPDWHIDRLRFRGSVLNWLLDGTTAPDRLEVAVDGLAMVVQMGDPQMDYLFAAQARANRIRAELGLSWDAGARSLAVEQFEIDFPGQNRVGLSARIDGVDLSSTGAAQMSVTSFAVTEADLVVQSHGLFETYALMSYGPILLPREGDMEVAARLIRGDLLSMVDALPEASFPAPGKAALRALIGELPNPAGSLSVSMRSAAGFGPSRVMRYAVTGAPDTLADAAPLLDGVVFDIGWTHEETP